MKFLRYFFIGLMFIIKKILNYLFLIPKYLISGIIFIIKPKKMNNSSENKITKKFIPITIISLSIITYLISIFILTRWYVQSERSKKTTSDFIKEPITNIATNSEDINQYEEFNKPEELTPNENTTENSNNTTNIQTFNTNMLNINLNYYIQKNNETVAWILVNGTKVNYPVVKHSDNDFYLEHDFYQRKTANGWIFADYRNNFDYFDNNTIIYGHNLINNTMFGTIPDLLKKSWYNNEINHYIKLSTKNANTLWKIFSVYKIEPTTDYLQTKFNSNTNYEEFLSKIKNRSIYNFNVELNYTDKIITLSTCDDIGTKRVVVHAKLIDSETK